MSDVLLSQNEADFLLQMEKHRVNDRIHELTGYGDKLAIPLLSSDQRDKFILDISQGRIDLSKITYQNRAKQTVILARLDIGGRPHRNPDGQEISCPHLHIYKEGYLDRWALPLPTESFVEAQDPWQLLQDFMGFCHVVTPPVIEKGIFYGK